MDETGEYTGFEDVWMGYRPALSSDFLVRPRIVELCGDVDGEYILDAGCGAGQISRMLVKRGAEIRAYDSNPGFIEKAKGGDTNNITYSLGDVRHGIEDGGFQKAVSSLVYPHLRAEEIYLANEQICKSLEDNGKFIMATIHPDMIEKKPDSKWVAFFPEDKKRPHKEGEMIRLYILGIDEQRIPVNEAYHHSTGFMKRALEETGFEIKGYETPMPTRDMINRYPDMWTKDDLVIPQFEIYHAEKRPLNKYY